MKNMKLKLIMLTIGAFLFSSCSYRVLDFTLISTKNVDLSRGASFERGKTRVEGKDMVHLIIYIPLGRPNLKEAVDRAVESIPGCIALLDGVVYSKFWWIPFLYGQQSITIEGTPLIDPNLTYNLKDIPTFGKIQIDKDGKFKSVENISSTEYYALKEKVVKDSKVKRFKNSIEIE
ncbi:MAG TPA: hypothetical protein VFC65_12985 [Prolixibacteraceae bacterium]|nr:hypothetical protein [Prolixibacteraceae bacterium]